MTNSDWQIFVIKLHIFKIYWIRVAIIWFSIFACHIKKKNMQKPLAIRLLSKSNEIFAACMEEVLKARNFQIDQLKELINIVNRNFFTTTLDSIFHKHYSISNWKSFNTALFSETCTGDYLSKQREVLQNNPCKLLNTKQPH